MNRERAFFGIILALLAALLVGALRAQSAESPAPQGTPPAPAKVAVIPVHGDIDYGLYRSLQRRINTAIGDGATVLIFELDSYGGALKAGEDIGNLVLRTKSDSVRTVAYVHNNAISAGAIIALAAQDIFMRHGTRIGDAQAIMISPQTSEMQTAPEKVQSFVRAVVRNYCQSNGHPVLIGEAMVDADLEVHLVRHPDGRIEFLTTAEVDALSDEAKANTQRKLVVGKGKLLTMTAAEAEEYQLSRATVDDLAEVIRRYGGDPETSVRHETNWSEEMVRRLNSPAVSSILMIVGMLALYLAFKTPGMGAPEAVAALCFGLLFLSKYMVGLASVIEVALFAVGVVLIAIEVFLIPGFGLVGITGFLCVLAALVLSFQRFTIPSDIFEFRALIMNMAVVFGSLLTATVVFMVLLRFLPRTPMLNKLVLNMEEKASVGYTVSSAERRDLIGLNGTALSTLRPSGRAQIGSEVMIVVSDGEFIESGAAVVVSDVRGNRVVVRRA